MSEQLRQVIVQFVAVVVPTVGLIMLGLYAKFGRGLATWLIGKMVFTGVVAATTAFIGGVTHDTPIVPGIVLLIATPIGLYLFASLYRDVVVELKVLADELEASSAELAATAQETATAATQQVATVAEISATVQELAETSRAAAASAEEVEAGGANAASETQKGVDAVAEAREVLDLVAHVRELVGSVNSLADQSNFLAVSAGIEAAKAGEHGRGFTVVAAEVRSLADQSKRAAAAIRTALSGAEEGREALRVTEDVVGGLATVLDASADRARHIAAVSGQQAVGLNQISEALSTMAGASESVRDASVQLEEAVDALQELSRDLDHYIHGTMAEAAAVTS